MPINLQISLAEKCIIVYNGNVIVNDVYTKGVYGDGYRRAWLS